MFAGINGPAWQDSLDLFNDDDFGEVIAAYKQAKELAKDFTEYQTSAYSSFRVAYRNILDFETAKRYLEPGFVFEYFKADYLANKGSHHQW